MSRLRNILSLTVLVASLGYFVDMFDLTIFGVVRMESLKALGNVVKRCWDGSYDSIEEVITDINTEGMSYDIDLHELLKH